MPDFTQLSPADRAEMLATIGIESPDELFRDVPENVRFPSFDLPPALVEMDAFRHLAGLAAKNVSVQDWPCFIGAGAYNHHVPSAVPHIMGLPQFYTAYTPYQPEVSQGTLQTMFEFQSLVCDLFQMDVANASVYDGASGLAEAVLMAERITGRSRIVLSASVNPQWRNVVHSYVRSRGVDFLTTQLSLEGENRMAEQSVLDLLDDETACVVVQQPDFFGQLRDLSGLADAAHARGALLVAAVGDATSLGLLAPPGAWGADIAVAEGQALGLPLQFGGPWAGLMACKQEHVRQLPGRIAGQTADSEGRRGFVLTLQAREQHIRREKARSNICTSQTLLAIGITAYLSLLGPDGLRQVARLSHAKATYAAKQIGALPGYRVLTTQPFHNEILMAGPRPADEVRDRLTDAHLLGGYPVGADYPALPNGLLLAFTEKNTREEIDSLVQALAEVR